ncbi:hypothetical protein CCICO_01770 [Corynebacterium ciconiae DSM 44920]|uniref:hypothetical protein n=1 Tax=Corynebacterium ciconiae TaxID=227319 RepID=UPI0003A80BC5|nr:hypothetical protein [Corynebacterium ciconiae]WKD60406.1 hypothetical protein CCICO_01770 [Corynebacterium ciconiae DSM 44920]
MGVGQILLIIVIFLVTLVTPTVVLVAKLGGGFSRPSEQSSFDEQAAEEDTERFRPRQGE